MVIQDTIYALTETTRCHYTTRSQSQKHYSLYSHVECIVIQMPTIFCVQVSFFSMRSKAVFLYCYPACLSCPAHMNGCEYRCRVWHWMSLLRPGVIKQHKNLNPFEKHRPGNLGNLVSNKEIPPKFSKEIYQRWGRLLYKKHLCVYKLHLLLPLFFICRCSCLTCSKEDDKKRICRYISCLICHEFVRFWIKIYIHCSLHNAF